MNLTSANLQVATQAATQTVQAEATALQTLATALATDPNLPKALELILQTQGRVVVTGVGKSGHIGGKIAASLASTGTPSLFVHPTEALHGDLGMITKADTILALSHSGESKELAAIIAYATRFAIPLIAITAKPTSTLGQAATLVLNTRVEREACPLNLAPTTSTTATLALADALTVALMHLRGFTKENFAAFHPGGKLGAQLKTVAEIMLKENLPLLPENTPMTEALVTLTQRNLGCIGLTNPNGELTGIFTDGDLKRAFTNPQTATQLLTKTAQTVATKNPKIISPTSLATQAVAHMETHSITRLWVVENGKPLGLLRLQDCLTAGVI